jgi:hypothetical protein
MGTIKMKTKSIGRGQVQNYEILKRNIWKLKRVGKTLEGKIL